MKRKAIIADGKIVDIIIAGDDLKAPHGSKLIETAEANIGDFYEQGRFTRPKAKLKREDLLRIAHAKRQLSSLSGLSFELENGSKIRVPTDYKTRQDLFEIASLGIDSKFVFPDGQFELTAKDFSELARKLAEHTAKNHAVLAEVIEAIGEEKIVFDEQINKPEMLNLKKWSG